MSTAKAAVAANPPGLSVVIPALNEEGGIGATLDAVLAVTARLDMPTEVIVVNDGSADRTAEIAADKGVVVIHHPIRSGYGHSLKTGIRAARYETIAITDADGTYPIEDIPDLVASAERFDLVIGSRTGPHYRKHLWSSPMRTTFLLLTNFVTGEWINDPNSGLRVFHRRDMLPILDRLPSAFSFTTTQTLIMTLEHKFVLHRPIDYRARIGRSKVRPLRDALRVGQTLVEMMLRYNPLKLFLLLALFLWAIALPVLLAADTTAGAVIGGMLLCTGFGVLGAGMAAVTILGRNPEGS